MPRVSVIVPVFNAEAHLRQCVDSILNQTLTDIEVLCVDDASTDDSVEVLRGYAADDSRLKVLHQESGGAGAARNHGLRLAVGEYLSFLDADDFFEPTMLQEAYEKCVADDADVAVYRTRYFDMGTGRFAPAEGLLNTSLLPEVRPFSSKDMPDHILDFVSPAPWNKMFKRAFVTGAGLKFQEISRANDLLFTKLALVNAERITFINKVLVNYRIGTESNLQATNHQTPFAFHESLSALRNELKRSGKFAEVERSYTNMALSACLYNLHSLKTPDAFNALYFKLRDEYFAELGIDGCEQDELRSAHHHAEYLSIKELDPEAYLIRELEIVRTQRDIARERLKSRTRKLDKAEARLRKIQESRWYRLAHGIGAFGRRVKKLATGSRKAG